MDQPDLFSVPRRFDLITVLVATTAYAVLFTGLRLLDFSPEALGIAGGLFAAVAAGQAIAEKHENPRAASIVAAMIFWTAYLAYAAVRAASDYGPQISIVPRLMFAPLGGAFLGALTGYLVGVLAAGVFLVSYHLRNRLAFASRRNASDVDQETSPWDEVILVEVPDDDASDPPPA